MNVKICVNAVLPTSELQLKPFQASSSQMALEEGFELLRGIK